MDQLSPEQVKKRSDSAWMIRNKWKSILEEAYEMVFAGINPYSSDKKSPRPMNRQFDATAVQAVIKLTNRLLVELTPPWENWVNINAGPLLEMQFSQPQLDEIKPNLEKASKMANLVINSGNSVDARRSAFMDVVIAGMGGVLCLEDAEDDIDPLIDLAVSQAEIAIEENEKSQLSGIYRYREIKIREIEDLWPDAVIPEDVTSQMDKNKDPSIMVLEATYRGKKAGKVIWYYEILYCKSGKEAPTRIVERTYDVCPWTIWRWIKLPGIPYGPGPVLLALADIRTANKVMEMIFQNAALALAGMYLARDDGVLNPANISIQAGGIIPVQSTGGSLGASLVPLSTNREFNVGQIILDDLRMTIKKHLFDTSLPPDRGTPSSATEIIQRVKELNQDIGVGVGRMEADTVQYVRSRIEMLQKRGMLPPMKIDQFTLKIQINAPLVRAQRMSEVENVINWYQMAVSLGGPETTMMVAATERILAWLAEQMGIPVSLLRDDVEQEKLQQQIAGLLAAQQAAANQNGQAQGQSAMQAA